MLKKLTNKKCAQYAKSFTHVLYLKVMPQYTDLMDLSKVSLTNFGFGISGSIVTQSLQSSQLHLNWKLLRWYENQFEKLHSLTNATTMPQLQHHKSVANSRNALYNYVITLLLWSPME